MRYVLTVKKPAYVGMCILDLACEFDYDYIKNKHGNNSKLFITNNDSLMYEIKAEDILEDFSSNKTIFGFNNYSAKSKYMLIKTN